MSSTINEMINNRYRPTMALILYQEENAAGTEKCTGGQEGAHNYFEAHEIDPTGILLEGHPLQAETLAGIAKIYHKQEKPLSFAGLLPECLLSFMPGLKEDDYQMMWWRPAGTQHLYFSESLNIPNGPAPVPAMLWKVNNRKLEVFALPADERPSDSTKLLQAPFHNVSASGSVCLGSAKTARPQKTYEAQIAYWEKLFWKSEFTHLNNESTIKGNLNLIWKRLIKARKPKSWAELDVLLPAKKTIKTLL